MEKHDDAAFVLWLEAGADDAPVLRGRIEHVQSSQRVPFTSAEELVRFLEQRLRVQAKESGD